MLKRVLLALCISMARGQDNAHVRIDTGGEIHVARGGSFVIGATPEVADPPPPSASPLPPPSPSPAPPPLHTTADLYIPFIASEGGYTDAITNLAPTTTSMSDMPSTGFTYASFNTASDANDYVAYPASSAAHVGTGDFTITFRMRTDTYSTADGGNHRRIYVTDGPSGNSNDNLQILLEPNNGGLQLYTRSNALNVMTTPSVADFAWHSCAVRRMNGVLSIWIDGVDVPTQCGNTQDNYPACLSYSGDIGSANNNMPRMLFGIHGPFLSTNPSFPTGGSYVGNLAQWAIYKRALTDAELVAETS